MLCVGVISLSLTLTVQQLRCAHAHNAASDNGSSEPADVDRGESASLDVRCGVCRTLLADLSTVAHPVRQQLEAEGTARGTTVADTTMKSIEGMCDRREAVPRLLGLYKIHDCEEDEASMPDSMAGVNSSHIGGLVSLSDDYAFQADAADGPLLPGQTAILYEIEEDKVMVVSENGTRWWYLPHALELVRSPACAQVARQRYTAEHYSEISAASMKKRTNSEAVQAWEVHAHRIMCTRYWKPLAEDIGDFVADSSVITAGAAFEFCVEKGLCKQERGKRHRSKRRRNEKRRSGKAHSDEL